MEDTLIMDAVINKYFAGETSDREEQFLMAWLEESEEHRKYFFELKSIWNARNVFAESADLGRFAAFMRSTDARIAKIAGEERARRRRGLLRWSMSAAAAVLLVVCAGFAWHFLAGPDIYRVYENNTETVTTVTLDDGTQVWLNSESSLVNPVRFGDGPREVTVTGEAYFDVAHDASRRFVVHADTVSVSVYGTAFNISSYADEGAIETTLVRGSVEVRSGHRRAMLQPGQQARVGREGAIFDVRQVAAEDYAAWTRGLFTFNDETIASICRKLSRWYGVEIVPRGVDADKVRYTGVVKRYETFAEMARLLARTDQIRADVEEGKIVLCIDRDDD